MKFKNTVDSSFFKKISVAIFICFCFFSMMLLSYGAIAFKGHLSLVELTRNIIQERSNQNLAGIFNGYFYWSDMINNVKVKNSSFIEAQVEEIKSNYSISGLTIYSGGEKVFSTGSDLPCLKTGVRYIVNEKKSLLAGKSFFLKDDKGKEYSEMECNIWLDMSPYIKELRPFLVDFELIPSSTSDKVSYGKAYLTGTRIKTSWIKFLVAFCREEPGIPLFLFVLSIIFYLTVVLMVQKHSLKLSWYERLRSLTSILEEKDSYTFGHGHRVAEYAVSISESMGIDKADLARTNLAAQCHDLGKIFVPDEILNKRGPLTHGELKYIQRHPVDSERIFLNLMKDRELGDIIRHHHERWDGKGYPDGLKEREIPFESRIIALADSFDAMTSQRPYRSAISMEDALYCISENSGKQFDPDLVPIAIKVLSEVYNMEKASTVAYRPVKNSYAFFNRKTSC